MDTNEYGSDFKTDQDAMIPIICALINKSDFIKTNFGNPLITDFADPFYFEEIVTNARSIYDAYIDNFKQQ